MKLFDKLDTLNGVGPKKKSYLEAMGLETISDLAEYCPESGTRSGAWRLWAEQTG